MRGREYERRVKRLEDELGDPRCTCMGPGLEIVRLRLGEEPPPRKPPPTACPVHLREQPGTLRIVTWETGTSRGQPLRGTSTPLYTVLEDGSTLIHHPEPPEMYERLQNGCVQIHLPRPLPRPGASDERTEL